MPISFNSCAYLTRDINKPKKTSLFEDLFFIEKHDNSYSKNDSVIMPEINKP